MSRVLGNVNFSIPAEVLVNNVASVTDFYAHLIRLLPDYERDSLINQAALRGIAAIFAALEARTLRLEREQDLSTAVDFLAYWERLFQLDRAGLSLDERRQQIRARLWSLKNAFREEDLRALFKTYIGNAQFEIDRNKHPVFKFKVETSKPKNYKDLDADLRRLLNTGYTWQITYKKNSWSDWQDKTWRYMGQSTWLESGEETIM